MAKKFMFVCVGILALTVAFLLGAQFGRAEYVDHSVTGIVACMHMGGTAYVLVDNGTVWYSPYEAGGWYEAATWTLPVPASEVRCWVSDNIYVSTAGDLWYRNGATGTWTNHGAPPNGLAIQPSTWGQIKAQSK